VNNRPGCLSGLLKLFILDKVFDWLQGRFGFGRGSLGCGCGFIFMIIFLALACSVVLGTDWLSLSF